MSTAVVGTAIGVYSTTPIVVAFPLQEALSAAYQLERRHRPATLRLFTFELPFEHYRNHSHRAALHCFECNFPGSRCHSAAGRIIISFALCCSVAYLALLTRQAEGLTICQVPVATFPLPPYSGRIGLVITDTTSPLSLAIFAFCLLLCAPPTFVHQSRPLAHPRSTLLISPSHHHLTLRHPPLVQQVSDPNFQSPNHYHPSLSSSRQFP